MDDSYWKFLRNYQLHRFGNQASFPSKYFKRMRFFPSVLFWYRSISKTDCTLTSQPEIYFNELSIELSKFGLLNFISEKLDKINSVSGS